MNSTLPKPHFRSRIVNRLVSRLGLSNTLRARHFGLDYLLRRPPVLELYYEAGDPHSHLAAQLLPALIRRLKIPVVVKVVGESDPVVYPEAAKQREYALQDAVRIAPAYGLHFPADARPLSSGARLAAARKLLAASDAQSFCESEPGVAAALFSGEDVVPDEQSLGEKEAKAQLEANAERRAALGNYLPGVWQLNGNWYWGVDRLGHLLADLRAGNWIEGEEPVAAFSPEMAALPALDEGATELEFFFSFRSPYSYLAAESLHRQYRELALPLRIRPVLPMAMRGMKIPRSKGLYLSRDAKREATRLGMPFGLIADPLGVGVERCLTLFTLLDDPRAQLEFLVSHCRAVWSQGIDVATDEGLRVVWERAGQDWEQAQEKLAAGMDLAYAEENRKAMFDAGCWGVPSFRVGSFVTWGNDRLWMVSEVLRRSPPFQV